MIGSKPVLSASPVPRVLCYSIQIVNQFFAETASGDMRMAFNIASGGD
jgi:hypothetical protein